MQDKNCGVTATRRNSYATGWLASSEFNARSIQVNSNRDTGKTITASARHFDRTVTPRHQPLCSIYRRHKSRCRRGGYATAFHTLAFFATRYSSTDNYWVGRDVNNSSFLDWPFDCRTDSWNAHSDERTGLRCATTPSTGVTNRHHS